MENSLVIASYITISCIAFVASKIVIAVLLYRRWKRKQEIYADGFSGMILVFLNLATPETTGSNLELLMLYRREDGDVQVSMDTISYI